MIKSPTSPVFHGVMLDAAVQKNAETVRLEERTRIASARSDRTRKAVFTSGRGLHLVRALMDDVSFEENGTVVRMRKRVRTLRG